MHMRSELKMNCHQVQAVLKAEESDQVPNIHECVDLCADYHSAPVCRQPSDCCCIPARRRSGGMASTAPGGTAPVYRLPSSRLGPNQPETPQMSRTLSCRRPLNLGY